jgi:hypothetical protein
MNFKQTLIFITFKKRKGNKMAYSYEELDKMCLDLTRNVFEQDKMLDELISKKSLKLKKSSQQYFRENERKELFLRKKGLMEEYKQFVSDIRDSEKSKV